jgi:endonuclease YncB( thermonuclease family)
MATRAILAAALAALTIYGSSSAIDWIVTEVVSGESFISVDHTVRIKGIDAPPAEEARQHLEDLIGGSAVTVLGNEDYDQWGRWYVYISDRDGRDVGARMIDDGYARANTRDSHDKMDEYIALELDARRNLRGLWANPGTLSIRDEILRNDPTSTTPVLDEIDRQSSPTTIDPYFPVYVGDFLYHVPGCWLIPAEPPEMSFIQDPGEDLLKRPVGFAVIEGYRADTHCGAPVLDTTQVNMDDLRFQWLQAFDAALSEKM